MKWFVRKFTGYQICIGPDAEKEGDDYTHCIPLRESGEFGGYSTKRLTSKVKRAAVQAAESLGFSDPFWKDRKGKITMVHKAKIPHAKTAFKADGAPDWHAIHAALETVKEQEESGHYKITGTATEKQNADGSTDLTFTIHRVQTDPSASAA